MSSIKIGGADPVVGNQPDLGYEDNYVRDQVMELYQWSANEHEQRYCGDWYYYYRLYMNYIDRRILPDDYKSNIGVGLAFPIIELIHAHMMQPWVASDELIKVIPEEEAGTDRAPKVGAYINNLLVNRVHRSYAKHSLVKKSGLIFGRGIMKPYIEHVRPMSLLKRIPAALLGVRLGSRVAWQKQSSTRRLNFDYVDPFNWWKVPGQRFLHDTDWTFERGYLTQAQIAAKIESGEWNDFPLEDGDAIGYDEFMLRRVNLEQGWSDQVRATSGHHSGWMRQPHRYAEFQGRLEHKETKGSKSKYKDMRVIISDEKWIAKKEALKTWNGRPGYIEWEPTMNPGSERPIGIIEPMEDILLEINDYENIALDNARKILESPLLIDPNSTKQDKLYLGPGALNWVRNPRQSVMPLEMKDLPRSFYHQIGFLNDLVQRISGVSDYFGGMNTGDSARLSKTATGMQLMANLAASRFGPLLTSLDHDFYREEARWIHETSKLWMSQRESMRMPGNPAAPFTSIAPDDFDALMTYNYNTRSINPNTDQQRQKFLEMIKILNEMVPFLQEEGYAVDHYEIAKMMMDEFEKGGSITKLIKQIQQQPAQPGVAPPGMTPPGQGPGAPGLDPLARLQGGASVPGRPSMPIPQPPNQGVTA